MAGSSGLLRGRRDVAEGVHADLSVTTVADMGWKALARNVFGAAAAPGAERLAAYVRAAVRHLATQDGSALSRGALGFPDPDQQAVEDDPLTPCCDKPDDEVRADC